MKYLSKIIGIYLIAIMMLGCQGTQAQTLDQTTLTVTGSNTVFPIINVAAQEWSESSGVEISASGPGSGAGMTALINGQTDLAPMSRAPRDSELQQASVEGLDVNITIIAKDALVIILHPDNPITSLSADKIRGIFNGSIRYWSMLGWSDSLENRIKVVERDENSGTHDFFNSFFLDGAEVPASELGEFHSQFTSTPQLFELVASEPNAIGYGGFGYLTNEVKAIGLNGVDASKQGAADGSYPLWRPLYVVFDNNGVPATGVDFVEFLLGTRGQEIADEEGYVGCGTLCGYNDADDLSGILQGIGQTKEQAFDYDGPSEEFDDGFDPVYSTPADTNDGGLPFSTYSLIFGIGTLALIANIRRRH